MRWLKLHSRSSLLASSAVAPKDHVYRICAIWNRTRQILLQRAPPYIERLVQVGQMAVVGAGVLRPTVAPLGVAAAEKMEEAAVLAAVAPYPRVLR